MPGTVLYIAPYVHDSFVSVRGLSTSKVYQAGKSKIEGIIKSICYAGYDVVVLSPISIPSDTWFWSKSLVISGDRSTIVYPPLIEIRPRFLKYLILTILTALFALKLSFKYRFSCCIFYNMLPHTALPSMTVKVIRSIPSVIEFEDDYSHFSHNRMLRLFNVGALSLIRNMIDGAVCVNSILAEKLGGKYPKAIARGVFSLNSKLGIEDESPHKVPMLIFSGSLNSDRGYDLFLQALRHIEYPVDVFISGVVGIRDILPKDILPVVRITSMGYLEYSKYLEVLNQADIAVSCYRADSKMSTNIFPSKIIEYMAYGKIIVTSRVADIETMGENLFVFYDEDSPVSIASAINDVLNDISKYRSFGKNAARYFMDNCSVPATARKLSALLTTYEA